MNTSEYVPYEAIAKNIFANKICPEFPGIGGTGFFVKFPPYLDIFYVTARHCIYSGDSYGDPSDLRIHVAYNRQDFIKFDSIIDQDSNNQEIQDFIIYHVDESNEEEILDILKERALVLWHQDDVDNFIKLTVKTKQRFRTVGFPEINSNIEYTDNGKSSLVLQPRGFHGIARESEIKEHFSIVDTNWKDEFHGFSGSPILIFTPKNTRVKTQKNLPKDEVHVIVIGMLLMGSKEFNGIHFININYITNAIAFYINSKEGSS